MLRRFLMTLASLTMGTMLFAEEPTGNWVREVVMPESGNTLQAVLTFKSERLSAKFIETGYSGEDKLKTARFEFECNIHRSADGYVTGRVVGVEMDLKNAPHDLGITVESLKGLNKAYGEPFCFRCEIRDDVLTVADLRLPIPEGFTGDVKGIRETIAASLGGKYKSTETAEVPLPKVEKTRNGSTAWLTMPRRPILEMPTRPKQTIIPTAAELAPPGTLKSDALLPLVKESWLQSTAPQDPSKIPPLNVPSEQPQPFLIPPLTVPGKPVPSTPPSKANPVTIPPAK